MLCSEKSQIQDLHRIVFYNISLQNTMSLTCWNPSHTVVVFYWGVIHLCQVLNMVFSTFHKCVFDDLEKGLSFVKLQGKTTNQPFGNKYFLRLFDNFPLMLHPHYLLQINYTFFPKVENRGNELFKGSTERNGVESPSIRPMSKFP